MATPKKKRGKKMGKAQDEAWRTLAHARFGGSKKNRKKPREALDKGKKEGEEGKRVEKRGQKSGKKE